MSVTLPYSALEQAQLTPEKFELIQIIRLLNRHFSNASKPFKLFIEAQPLPNNSMADVNDFELIAQQATITSNKTSLTSGNNIVPVYIYETLLTAYHHEDNALADFLNIFNDRYFKLYVRTEEKTHLLLTDEIESYVKKSKVNRNTLHDSSGDLGNSIGQLCALPNDEKIKKWLNYSLILGRRNRSQADLQQVLSDYFNLNLQVTCTSLTKYQLTVENWTRLGRSKALTNLTKNKNLYAQNNQLGQGFLLGKRCWMANQRLNITVKVDHIEQLCFLIKKVNWYHELVQMTRYYLRDKTEIALYLQALDSWFKRIKLSSNVEQTMRLGRGCYLKNLIQDMQVVYLLHLVKDT